MAVSSDMSPTTSAGFSNAIFIDGVSIATLSLYSDTGVVEERVGAIVYETTYPGDTELRDSKGRVVMLTQARPTIRLTGAGTYSVYKSGTSTPVGVWSDITPSIPGETNYLHTEGDDFLIAENDDYIILES